MFQKVIGAILIGLGVILGIYLGVYQFLFKGILDVVDFADIYFHSHQLHGNLLGIGILKMMFAGVVGWVTFAIVSILGVIIYNKD